MKCEFDEYRMYPYKVQFLTDDIFRLSGNQRSKLQYHILAQRFPLVHVSEQDKWDLLALCRAQKTESAQRWLNRMQWPDGLEKMITFGVSLKVRGTVKGVWCYMGQMEAHSATYRGIPMTWERWAQPIMDYLNDRRATLEISKTMSQSERSRFRGSTYDNAMMMLSYQSGQYMTLPGEEYRTLKEWVYQYFRTGTAPLPYHGEIPDGNYEFTIDFEKDVEIVAAPYLKEEMGAYNAEHNAEHNKDMGRCQTEKRFEQLEGDAWTTQEIYAQGFSRKTLDKFVEHGLIERVKRGHYVRKFV